MPTFACVFKCFTSISFSAGCYYFNNTDSTGSLLLACPWSFIHNDSIIWSADGFCSLLVCSRLFFFFLRGSIKRLGFCRILQHRLVGLLRPSSLSELVFVEVSVELLSDFGEFLIIRDVSAFPSLVSRISYAHLTFMMNLKNSLGIGIIFL